LSKKDKYIVGLDIGSTKTCVMIAKVDEEQVNFLALGAAESKGLRKGLIVNLDSTVSSIRRAVEEAESVANVPVESAVIGVAGNHVRGVNSRGGITLGHRARDIERDDIRRAAGAGIAVDCRRSGQGGTWRARMTDGRSGNNGKDAARRESSETGLRIDLLRKPDCCAALQPCWNSLRI